MVLPKVMGTIANNLESKGAVLNDTLVRCTALISGGIEGVSSDAARRLGAMKEAIGYLAAGWVGQMLAVVKEGGGEASRPS